MINVVSNRFLILIFLFDITLLLGAVLFGYSDHNVTYYFKEGKLITFLSSFHLVAIAMMSWIIYETERGSGDEGSFIKSKALIWLLIAVGFLFLAFDEVMKIHETIDFSIHHFFEMKETALTDRLDDVLVLLYVLVGGGFLYAYRRTLLSFWPFIRTSLITGFILVVVMIVLDALTNRHDIVTNKTLHRSFSVAEECAKILAEYFFFLAAYRCLKRA